MNPIKNIVKFFSKEKSVALNTYGEAGWSRVTGELNTYAQFKGGDYENSYPSVSKIANAFMMIEPYAIDATGKPVESNIIDRIYTPNQQMSAADFREALAVMTSVHNRVNIRVHYSGDQLTTDTITGFTFIENGMDYTIAGKRYFHLPNGTIIDGDEVITLKGINPYDLSKGFSPTKAARRWIDIDDYIAMYQSGFFKNGAVPAGQFIITARTLTEFKDIRTRLEEKHRGAGKNNNVTYAYRPVDENGKQQQAQIEWVPFNVQNKDMALKDLFEQANKKIDSAYGVPASIRGVNDSNTYASVREDERIFAQYVVKPVTMKIWNKFTHELNRITGGTGLAIVFDLELPKVADEEKVKEEALAVKDARVQTWLNLGYSITSVSEYLKSGDITDLEKEEVTVKPEDEPDVTEPGEIEDAPVQPDKNDTLTRSKEITPEMRTEYENLLFQAAQFQFAKQVNGVTESDLSKSFEADKDEVETFTNELLLIVTGLMVLEGARQRREAISLILTSGLDASGVRSFALTQAQQDQYRSYLLQVANSYTETNATLIRTTLDRAAEQGLSFGQTKTQLQGLVEEGYQATRLARTEVSRAGSEASVYSMENIAEQTGYEIVKIWNANPGACEYCMAMNGKSEPVEGSFVPLDGVVRGQDGGELVNNFVDIHDTTLHPNCSCFATYEVRS